MEATKKRKKVALFGGTFDPIHTDHLNIAKACKEKLGFDEVWLIPVYLNPFKKEQHSSVENRLAMLRIVADQYDFIKINQYEVLKPTRSYTYQTVKHLQEVYDFDFSFIMGSDQLDDFESWDHFDELIKMIDFKVFKRKGYMNQEVVDKYNLEVFTFDNHELSSTEIRNLHRLWLQIPAVNDYANYHLLYLKERLEDHMDHDRYIHCLNVGDMAVQLAKKFGASEWKARVAGTLHDVTKRWPEEKAEAYLTKWMPFLLEEPKPVWHSFTGYLHLQNDWLIKDQEILQAVFNHTVGAPDMGLLDKIVFCADKISKERDYPHVEEYRQACFDDIEVGFKKLLKMQYDRALEKNGPEGIGAMLKVTYDYYITNNGDED